MYEEALKNKRLVHQGQLYKKESIRNKVEFTKALMSKIVEIYKKHMDERLTALGNLRGNNGKELKKLRKAQLFDPDVCREKPRSP